MFTMFFSFETEKKSSSVKQLPVFVKRRTAFDAVQFDDFHLQTNINFAPCNSRSRYNAIIRLSAIDACRNCAIGNGKISSQCVSKMFSVSNHSLVKKSTLFAPSRAQQHSQFGDSVLRPDKSKHAITKQLIAVWYPCL